MGYSYTMDGKLCCDVCDKSGEVRKIRCPFGWCQSLAMCPTCRKEHPEYNSKATHRERGCEKYVKESEAQSAQEAFCREKGIPFRVSALGVGNGRVHVLFAAGRGASETIGYYMDKATYEAIPLFTVATVDDYRKHGTLEPAPGEYHFRKAV